jgi:16S rRNA (guanine1207-N2)-methyltransferase
MDENASGAAMGGTAPYRCGMSLQRLQNEPTPVLSRLRRYPDLEAPNLFAVDATDRLLLDEAADLLANSEAAKDVTADTTPSAHMIGDSDRVVVVNDHYGALTLGALERFGISRIRTYADTVVAEEALCRNAELVGYGDRFEQHGLDLACSLVPGWC